MISFFNGAASPFRLSRALLIYSQDGGGSYATDHAIRIGERGPEIGAGAPISAEGLRQLISDIAASAQRPVGLLPEAAISVGRDWIAWWCRSGVRTMFFNVKATDKQPGFQRAGRAAHPALFFAARQRQLWVFALGEDARPTSETPLFHAPLMNVHESGSVCLGSQPAPDAPLGDSVPMWVDGFFSSEFTHSNHAGCVRYPGGASAFSLANLDGEFGDRVPTDCLVPADMTVGRFLSILDEGR